MTMRGLKEIYGEWQAARQQLSSLGAKGDAPEGDALYDKRIALEDEAIAIQPQSLDDLARMILIADLESEAPHNAVRERLTSAALEILAS